MEMNTKFRIYLGISLVGLLLLMNIFISVKYYNISSVKMTDFYFFQSNVSPYAVKRVDPVSGNVVNLPPSKRDSTISRRFKNKN